MDKDTRNMKKVCSLLHDLRNSPTRRANLSLEDVVEMIETAEKVYHAMKDEQGSDNPF